MRILIFGLLLALAAGCGSVSTVEREATVDATNNAEFASTMSMLLGGLAGGAILGKQLDSFEGVVAGTAAGAAVGSAFVPSQSTVSSGGSYASSAPTNMCPNPYGVSPVPPNQFVCAPDGYWHGCSCDGGSCRLAGSSNMGCDPARSLGHLHS